MEHFTWHVIYKTVQISLNIFQNQPSMFPDFFFPIPAMQMIWSPNIVCLHFLNIFHISFMKTQYPTDVRLPCPSPTLESGSHRLFPLGCPSQSILLSYHSLNALFWYSVFYEVVHNGPDRSIFLPPRTSPCTLSMGFT